jgi:glycosyltransferase involved in cell wall biosynthesis
VGAGVRILIVHEFNLPYGGGERYLQEACQALRALGHRVVVVCAAEWNKGFIPADATYGVANSVGLRTGFWAWREYENILRRECADVVCLHGIRRHFISPVVLGRLARRHPSVLFVHHAGLVCHTARKVIPSTSRRCEWPMGRRCFSEGCVGTLDGSLRQRWHTALLDMWRVRALWSCRRVIAPSGFVREELCRNRFPADRIRLLPWFTTRCPAPPAPGRNGQILWVGRLDAGKGLGRFLAALGRLREREWRAVVVGDGTDTAGAGRLAAEAGIAGRVVFRGRLDGEALDAEYAAAGLVAFTSGWAETFGMVGIEAMAFGKPVVAFDVGGVREWLADGESGFLVPAGDEAGLAWRLSKLLGDPEACRRMGEAGRRAVETRFRLRHHLPQLLSTLEETLGG